MPVGVELLIALAALAALALVDVLAVRYGVDSRDGIRDDRTHPNEGQYSFPFWK